MRTEEALRTRVLRTCELRKGVPLSSAFLSSALAYPPASSPKSTLAGVFDRMRRAARIEKLARITERLAPQFQRSASPAEVTRLLAAKRLRESERVRLRLPDDD
jgi:hypothetical protein